MKKKSIGLFLLYCVFYWPSTILSMQGTLVEQGSGNYSPESSSNVEGKLSPQMRKIKDRELDNFIKKGTPSLSSRELLRRRKTKPTNA